MMIQEMWHVAYHIDLYSIPISASITSVARPTCGLKPSEIRRKIWQNTASHMVKSCEIPKKCLDHRIISESSHQHIPKLSHGPGGQAPWDPLGSRARRPLPSLSREKDRHRLEQRSMGLPLNHPSHYRLL